MIGWSTSSFRRRWGGTARQLLAFFDLKVREFICMPRLRVEDVLRPVIELTRQGATPEAIAGGLQVDPAVVLGYVRIYEQVTALVASSRLSGRSCAG